MVHRHFSKQIYLNRARPENTSQKIYVNDGSWKKAQTARDHIPKLSKIQQKWKLQTCGRNWTHPWEISRRIFRRLDCWGTAAATFSHFFPETDFVEKKHMQYKRKIKNKKTRIYTTTSINWKFSTKWWNYGSHTSIIDWNFRRFLAPRPCDFLCSLLDREMIHLGVFS